MIRFIQAIPNIVPRLIAQIHSPAIQDIIIRLISSEEAGVAGVIQWLAQEKLVSRLTSLLSPFQAPHVHVLVTELLKNIVTLCAPPPFNPLGGNMQEQQSAQGATSGTRDNRMVRELVSEESIRRMVGFMLDPLELSDIAWKGLNGDGTPHPADAFIVHPLPSIASAASSLSSISAILVELIRRNNSDFAEPHLFHTLRNRLINMRMEQGAPLGQMEGGDREDQDRERMEEAVKGMVEAMGIVHLKSLMDVFCERFERLYQLLLEPRSQVSLGMTCLKRIQLRGRNWPPRHCWPNLLPWNGSESSSSMPSCYTPRTCRYSTGHQVPAQSTPMTGSYLAVSQVSKRSAKPSTRIGSLLVTLHPRVKSRRRENCQ